MGITHLSTARHRARKAHLCHDCEGEIPPGEVYERRHYVYDRSAYSLPSHLGCAALGLHPDAQDWAACDEGLGQGWLSEVVGEWDRAAVERLLDTDPEIGAAERARVLALMDGVVEEVKP